MYLYVLKENNFYIWCYAETDSNFDSFIITSVEYFVIYWLLCCKTYSITYRFRGGKNQSYLNSLHKYNSDTFVKHKR